MMIDVFTQHRDLRVVQIVSRSHVPNLGDQILHRRVLDLSFVEQIGLDTCRARCRIKNLFFDRGVHREQQANLLGERLSIGGFSVTVQKFLVLQKECMNFLVVVRQ